MWKAIALAAAAVSIAAPAALAAPPGRSADSVILRQFELEGANGYEIEVRGGEGGGIPPGVSVSTQRGPISVSYEVPVDPGAGLHAVFGSLGTVAMQFERRKRSVTRQGKNCAYIRETGVFRGEFSFAGEDGYTSAEATSAEGEILRLPNGLCGFRAARGGFPDRFRVTQVVAHSRTANGFVQFGASRLGDEKQAEFAAELREVVGAMTISRRARAFNPAGFVLSPGKRSRRASVDPPAPFTGSARFADPAAGAPTWTGSLSITLPGAPEVALTGPGFAARLCLSQPILSGCTTPHGSAPGS